MIRKQRRRYTIERDALNEWQKKNDSTFQFDISTV